MTKNLKPGIYTHPFKYTVKIKSVYKYGRQIAADLFFTDNREFGKTVFTLVNPGLTKFLKGYKPKKV
jgi:hypothetical protein